MSICIPYIYIGIRRKLSEISGICLFLVTHLNHELTRAADELRVWLTRVRSDFLYLFHGIEAKRSSCILRVRICDLCFLNYFPNARERAATCPQLFTR